MDDTRVYLLDGGSMVLDKTYLFLDAGLTGPQRFPVYGVLIDHPEGRFLFDTGFDLAHTCAKMPATQPMQTERQTIPGQLDLLGLKPSDITHVMNSHYHLDHCGGNKHCKHATTICHKCELEAFASPTKAERFGYSDTSFAPHLRQPAVAVTGPTAGSATSTEQIDIFTPRFETLTGDQEVAKGVTLLETLGHTPGHYSLMVKLAHRRPMLFTADACYSQKHMDTMCIQAGNRDNDQARASLQRLKDLAEQHDAELFYSHDPDSWQHYQKAPIPYL